MPLKNNVEPPERKLKPKDARDSLTSARSTRLWQPPERPKSLSTIRDWQPSEKAIKPKWQAIARLVLLPARKHKTRRMLRMMPSALRIKNVPDVERTWKGTSLTLPLTST